MKSIKKIMKELEREGQYEDGNLRLVYDDVASEVDIYIDGEYVTTCDSEEDLTDYLVIRGNASTFTNIEEV